MITHTVRDRVEHNTCPLLTYQVDQFFFTPPPFSYRPIREGNYKKNLFLKFKFYSFVELIIKQKVEIGSKRQVTHVCVCAAMEFVFPKVGEFFKKFKFFRFRFSANAEETLAGIFFSCFIESYQQVVLSLSFYSCASDFAERFSPSSFRWFSIFSRQKKTKKQKLVSSTFYFVLE